MNNPKQQLQLLKEQKDGLTIEEANKMTPQQLCDHAVKKMVEQGEQCRNGGICAYSKGVKHCGIGHITDPKYHEGWGCDMVEELPSVQLPKPIVDNIRVFRQLQYFHDTLEQRKVMVNLNEKGIDTGGIYWKEWVNIIDKRREKWTKIDTQRVLL